MHAWKPSTVTCFYPIYYPDFSAFCFNSTILLEATIWKTVRPNHKLFLPFKSCKCYLLLFCDLSHCWISRKKALGAGITRHILGSATGTEMWRSLIWNLQWQFLSVPKNKRWWGEELQQDRGDALQNPNLSTWEGKVQVQIFTAREELSAWINQVVHEFPNYWS